MLWRFLTLVVTLSLCVGGARANYSITAIDDGESGFEKSAGSLILFGSDENRLRGWSHIVTHPERFAGVKLAPADYAIDERSVQTIDGCPVFQTVLLKKLGDWDQQHVNGIEPVFADAGLTLGDVRAIVLDIRINRARSYIPTVAEIAQTLGPWLTDEQLRDLDNGRIHLNLALLEAGYNDQDRSILEVGMYVEFDPEIHMDRWLRVKIPIEVMDCVFVKNYARTPAAQVENQGRAIIALRINPETRTGRVARNFLLERFTAEVPELYKEIALEIRRLEILRR